MHRKADADPSAGFDALAAAQGKVIPPPLAADSVNGVHSDASASARECTVRVIPATPTADALYRPLTLSPCVSRGTHPRSCDCGRRRGLHAVPCDGKCDVLHSLGACGCQRNCSENLLPIHCCGNDICVVVLGRLTLCGSAVTRPSTGNPLTPPAQHTAHVSWLMHELRPNHFTPISKNKTKMTGICMGLQKQSCPEPHKLCTLPLP